MLFATALAAYVLATAGAGQDAAYVISPENTRLGFTAEIAGAIPLEGRFAVFAGTAEFDTASPETGRLDVVVKAASAEADDGSLTGVLTGPGVFDAERFPEAKFTSKAVRLAGPGRLTIDGMLTLRGISLPLTLEARYRNGTGPDGRDIMQVDAVGTISRRAYGLTAFGVLLDDGVEIRIEALLLPKRS